MLFFCKWLDRTSLLVDASSKEDATALATHVAELKPVSVRAVPPNVFWCEIYLFDDLDPETDVVDADGPEEVEESDGTIVELVHILQRDTDVRYVLSKFEASDVGTPSLLAHSEPREEGEDDEPAQPFIQCGSEADTDDSRVVQCEREQEHEGDHAGEGLVWS